MIDFHCHLDLYPDALKILPRVAACNAFTLVVTTSPRAWQATSRVFAGYDNIKVAVGMHPEVVGKKAGERALLMSCIPKAGFVGEIGLDGSRRHQESMPLQESILREVLNKCERVGGKILSIHSRNAASRVLDLVEQYCRESTPVLHWFSGTVEQARRAVALGCWFSVGPAMLRGATGCAILRELPMDRILPETDGPFAKNRTVALMPWEAISIADAVALLWGTTTDDVCLQMKRNLLALIGNERARMLRTRET
ncbi:MAG: TatD family hydrolase [Candidatus Eisenbacteria bacterium]|nr:TatD family hydrolase [Candidatus Eisenbacteria bacterium]